MKKIIKLISIVTIILLTTGCAKIEMSIDINKDKSMNLSIIEAFDKKLIEQSQWKTTYKEQIDEIKKQGFQVKEYDKDGMLGYQFIKPISNIDKVSSKEKIIGDLSIIFKDNKKTEEKLFTVKKGFFKNKYTAKLKSSDIESITEQAEISNSTTEQNQTDGIIDPLLQMPEEESSNEINASTLTALEIKTDITINLPYKALSNNATSVENDGKKLIWNFTSKNKNIEFEFELYNLTTIYILISLGIVLLIIVGYSIFKKLRKDKPNGYKIGILEKLNNMKPVDLSKIPNQPNIENIPVKNTNKKQAVTKKTTAKKATTKTSTDSKAPAKVTTTKKQSTPQKPKIPKTKVEEIEVLDLNEPSKSTYKKE